MRGVTFNRQTRKWRAQLSRRYLGEYVTEAEAMDARRAAEVSVYGAPSSDAHARVEGAVAYIPLWSRGGRLIGEAIIDADDLALVSRHRWCCLRRTYPVTRIGARVVFLHRLLLVGEPGQVCDHINGNAWDARRANLRLCSQAENSRNRKMDRRNTSGFKGVTPTASGQWRARIWKDWREVHIGTFPTREAAAHAYDEAARKLHGQFAAPNGVEVWPA